MGLMEQRKRAIENALEKKFCLVSVNGIPTFQKADGSLFRLCSLPKDGFIVIEYAESYKEALQNRFEDGDLFYLDELDEGEMLQEILQEIET